MKIKYDESALRLVAHNHVLGGQPTVTWTPLLCKASLCVMTTLIMLRFTTQWNTSLVVQSYICVSSAVTTWHVALNSTPTDRLNLLTYVCILHTHSCTHAHAHGLAYTHMHTHTRTHTHMHTHTCTHAHTHTHTHTHTRTQTHTASSWTKGKSNLMLKMRSELHAVICLHFHIP